jgi:hypothetical protein
VAVCSALLSACQTCLALPEQCSAAKVGPTKSLCLTMTVVMGA